MGLEHDLISSCVLELDSINPQPPGLRSQIFDLPLTASSPLSLLVIVIRSHHCLTSDDGNISPTRWCHFFTLLTYRHHIHVLNSQIPFLLCLLALPRPSPPPFYEKQGRTCSGQDLNFRPGSKFRTRHASIYMFRSDPTRAFSTRTRLLFWARFTPFATDPNPIHVSNQIQPEFKKSTHFNFKRG